MSTQEERDEDLAFEQGFDSITAESEHEAPPVARAEPSAPASEPAATTDQPAVADPEKKDEPVTDPFAGLPQQVRDMLARVPALEARLDQAVRQANMVPALQSRLDKLQQQSPPIAEPSKGEPMPGQRKLAKVEALRKELPEIADALDEIVNDRQAQQREAEPAKAEPMQQQRDSKAEERVLSGVRPTWADDLVSSDFQLWLSQQPRADQARIQSTNVAEDILGALKAFDGYREQTKTVRNINERRSNRMQSGVVPQGDTPRRARPAAEADDEDSAMNAAFNKQRGIR
jgi:hypothetical protein